MRARRTAQRRQGSECAEGYSGPWNRTVGARGIKSAWVLMVCLRAYPWGRSACA